MVMHVDDMPSYLVIDPRNKPFGALLPLEIQNMILWMAWHMVHAEAFKQVLGELKKIEMCAVVEWCGTVTPSKQFVNPDLICMECGSAVCQHVTDVGECHWCLLYCNENKSLQELEVARALQAERDAIGCYDEARYRQFTQANKQRYAESLQFTFVRVLLPMLCYIEPRDLQCNCRRIAEDVTMEDIFLGLDLVSSDFVTSNNLTTFRNPREVRQDARVTVTGWKTLDDTRWRLPLKEEERAQLDQHTRDGVDQDVALFLHGQ